MSFARFRLPKRILRASSPGRTIVESQLISVVPMLISPIAVYILKPSELRASTYLLGMALLVLITVTAALLMRTRLLLRWAIVLPFLDIICLRIMVNSQGANPVGDGILLILPILWLAFSFGLIAAAVGMIVAALLTPFGPFVILTPASFTFFRLVGFPMLVIIFVAAAWFTGRRLRSQKAELDAQTALTTAALLRAETNETLLSEIIDSVDFAVSAFDAKGETTRVNSALLHAWSTLAAGNQLQESEPPPIFQSDGITPFAPNGDPFDRARLGEAFEGVLGWAGKAGLAPLAFSATSKALISANGEPAGAVIVLRNITTELDAVRSRDDLLAMVTHELRTPLTSIIGNIERVISGHDDPAMVIRRSEIVLRNSERMVEMLADLQRAGSTAESLRPIVITPGTDLRVIIGEAILSQTEAASKAAITITSDQPHPVFAAVDPDRLRQVVDNLLSNAIKYNASGGTVTVRASANEHTATIVVEDTGHGIPALEALHIFDLHFRAEAARKSGESGLGLGLAISRDIARRHGGDLTLDPASPHGGSSFRISLPTKQSSELQHLDGEN
jgi:two-component system phosphate regulon sensor histidine kinase PhoR